MENTKVEVTVCGKNYTLRTAESPEYVKDLAKQLDKRVRAFMEANDNISIITASVMVSMDILDENYKVNSNIDNIRTQIKSYVEEAAQARVEAEKLKKEQIEMRHHIKKLESELGLKHLTENMKNIK